MNAPTPQPRRSRAAALVDLLRDHLGLYHAADGRLYADIRRGGHRETHLLRDASVRRWAHGLHYATTGDAISAETWRSSLAILEAEAERGPERVVAVRVGELDGLIYIDLGGPEWTAVEIMRGGWRTIAEPAIRFWRPAGLAALPEPERGGSVDALREIISVDDDAWRMIIGWIVGAFRPRGPYPILTLTGAAGAGKSTVARMVRGLVDPHACPLRTMPRDERDLLITARRSWVVALDNVSGIPEWISDALCRLATGGGLATRTLYSDDEETLLDAQRPGLLTGISVPGTRDDLLDRSLIVRLDEISPARRRPESEILARYEAMRPSLLGGLINVVSHALMYEGDPREELPRMADHARWVAAAESTLRWPAGSYAATLATSRAEAAATVADASPLTEPLRALGAWSGTIAALLEALAARGGEATRRRGWPQNAAALGRALRRLAPSLRAVGIEIDANARGPEGQRRYVRIGLVTPTSSAGRPSAAALIQAAIRRASVGAPRANEVAAPDAARAGVELDVLARRYDGGEVDLDALTHAIDRWLGQQPDSRTASGQQADSKKIDGADSTDSNFPTLRGEQRKEQQGSVCPQG